MPRIYSVCSIIYTYMCSMVPCIEFWILKSTYLKGIHGFTYLKRFHLSGEFDQGMGNLLECVPCKEIPGSIHIYVLFSETTNLCNTHGLRRMRPFFEFQSLSPSCLPWFRKRSKPGMNAAKREKKISMFRLPSEDLTWIHVQNKRKRLRIGQQGGCKDADDGASDDPVKILMILRWWQGWWGRSWQVPVMLIESQSDDIGLYGFTRIILQVLLKTRKLFCRFWKSFRVGYWNMFGAGSRGCVQMQLRSIQHVRKCNCVASNMCPSAIA